MILGQILRISFQGLSQTRDSQLSVQVCSTELSRVQLEGVGGHASVGGVGQGGPSGGCSVAGAVGRQGDRLQIISCNSESCPVRLVRYIIQ